MEEKKVIDYIQDIEEKLTPVYPDILLRRQYAWWTLESITQKNKAQLIAAHTLSLNSDQENKLYHWVQKLVDAHMPIQYLIGSVPFAGLDILVEPPTLIPRPETEEWVIDLCQKLKQLATKNLHILDIGAGSGCIALTLGKALPTASITAVDTSEKALQLAQKNARHNRITNVTFFFSDLFQDLGGHTYDLIVSNPPYIAPDEWEHLDRSVTAWEDKNALQASDAGLFFIKKIIEQAPHFLRSNAEFEKNDLPNLVLEIGYTQAQAVADYMKQTGYSSINIEKDLGGKDRVVMGRVYVATTKP